MSIGGLVQAPPPNQGSKTLLLFFFFPTKTLPLKWTLEVGHWAPSWDQEVEGQSCFLKSSERINTPGLLHGPKAMKTDPAHPVALVSGDCSRR